MADFITIERTISAPITRVFDAFITPEDLTQWHHAGDGWQTPYAEVDAVVGGKQKIVYANSDGEVQFEIESEFTIVDKPNKLAYAFDGRTASVVFEAVDEKTNIQMQIDIEDENDKELQLKGWSEHIDNLEIYIGGTT
jgi:uncharacterized protein YndB with AHSA1/START domain